jgi:hypothetical protein
MKKTVVLSALSILLYSLAFSQDPGLEYYKSKEIKTLFDHNKGGGGFGALTLGYSVIDDRKALLMGARFGWITGHSLGIGIGATGFINEVHHEPLTNRDTYLSGGYGGLYIEPILLPGYPVHLSFPVLLGGGGVSYVSKESGLIRNKVLDSEAFLLIEPGVDLEFNLTRHFRFVIGASYRLPTTFDIGRSAISDYDIGSIKGMSYMVTFKFGKF